jgi:predicted ATP-dependent Lon-type protease
MNKMKTKKTIGNVLNYLLSAVLIISGTLKLAAFEPYMEVIKGLNPNYYENIYLIAFVAIISGILFAIPRTFTLGFIATLVFLGGTISAHMQAADNFIPQIIFVFLTGLTAYFKRPEWFKNK